MARRDYDDDDYTDEDEAPRRTKTKTKTKAAPARRRDDDDDEEEEETPRSKRRRDEEDDDDEPAPRRSRRRTEPDDDEPDEEERPRSRRRRDDDDEDEPPRRTKRSSRREDDDDEDEDDEPSNRRSRRRGDDDDRRERRGTRERGRSRRDDDDDDDEEEDERPARRARSGARRKVPQGGWGEAARIADSTASFAKSFNLKAGDPDAIIKFLEDQPYVNFRQHWIDELKGKKSFTCLEGLDPKGCPLCDMGHKPSAKFCFNILVLSEHDDPILRSFDVGVQLKDQFLNYNADKATGPLSKHYYVVKRPAGKSSRTSVQVVRGRDLDEDYGIEPLTAEDIEEFGADRHDKSILEIPTHKSLVELRSSLED